MRAQHAGKKEFIFITRNLFVLSDECLVMPLQLITIVGSKLKEYRLK